ncbi:MAG TPA: TIGR03013 family XrtA/PEP-CTERM system glycosyltransferase [Azospirillum sp.]|nr:TIGR03013 family XrtA/PEP-CTERM system glycosyltransferase [Azospirillum sp.]
MLRVFNIFMPLTLFALLALDALVLGASLLVGVTACGEDCRIVSRDRDPFAAATLYILFFMAALFAMGLYQQRFLREMWETNGRLVISLLLATGAQIAACALLGIACISDGVLAPSAGAAFVGLALVRSALWLRRSHHPTRNRVLVLGTGHRARAIEHAEDTIRPARFRCAGFVPLEDGVVELPPHRLVRCDDLLAVCRSQEVSEVVVAFDRRQTRVPRSLLLDFRLRGIRVVEASVFIERELKQVEIDAFYPEWVIYSNGSTLEPLSMAVKRAFDVGISLVMLLATLPIMALTALAIWLEDGRPVFYVQERVGQHGRVFRLLKFRSMRADAEKDGVARWAARGDSRITRVGRFIRTTRIDELPQIINVLRGEMSFVGPRPERPALVGQLEKEIPSYHIRHLVKPGITGWAQVSYTYGASIEDAREKQKFDLYYIKNYSPLFDLAILLQTVRVVLWPQGVR